MWQRGASALTNSSPTVTAYPMRVCARSVVPIAPSRLDRRSGLSKHTLFPLALRSVANTLFSTLADA